jgi:hypothetical protein
MLIRADARHIPLKDKSDSSFIEGFGLNKTTLHQEGIFLGPMGRTDVPSSFCKPQFLAYFFNYSQPQTISGLKPLYSEEWKKSLQNCSGFLVCDSPSEKRFSAFCTWLLYPDIPSEYFREKIQRLSFNLANMDSFTIRWLGTILNHSHRIGLSFNSNRSIRINYTCEVS